MQWTEEQSRAIEARGVNLLLSAAAGSGKTTVLVERILRLILEDGADVDRMLVVTFTRAAAADMRAKLARRLTALASEGNARCQDQAVRLERASITTLHAFCADFLRTHFEIAGVDPAFRILDDPIQRRLMDEALDETLEEAYAVESEALLALDYGRGPKTLRALTESLCRAMEERPDPAAWLEQCASESLIVLWMEELVRGAHRAIEQAEISLRQAIALPGCPPQYTSAIEKDLAKLEQLRVLSEYDPLFRALQDYKATPASGGRRSEPVDEVALESVKRLREQAKSALQSITMRDLPAAQAVEDARAQLSQIATLGTLAQAASQRFQEKKAEQSGLTYADLERYTLLALQDEETARAMRERFDYIFVDEYQDTSDIQEAIVSRICRADNRFMVGDVKQSIYRFRHAEPRLFIEKYNHYLREDGGTLLPLTRNFRSRPTILHFVNMIFERIMTGGDAEVEYDALARLNPGQPDGDPGAPVEIHLLEKNGAEDVDESIAELKTAERQGLFIARQIRAMMAGDTSLHYRDFALLTRSKTSAFTPMLPMLLAEGIPAYADGATGYFDSVEVVLALSMLRLISNRRRDLELIGVLHSPVVGLSADELAQIRISCRDLPYVDAVYRYAYGQDGLAQEALSPDVPLPDSPLARRLRDFLDLLQSWRLRAGALGLGALTRAVLDESGFYTYAGALPGGAQRQANLDRLVSVADRFDADVSGSLVRFLAHADRLKEKGDSDAAHLLGESDDVVRLMTVHKSKGLEFRVVFGAMLEKRFGGARAELLSTHRDLGIGLSFFDPVLRTRRKTLAQSAISERETREDAAEEMRILYVLLTRAQERLILVGSVSDAQRAADRWRALSHAFSGAKSHLDLIMSARAAAEEQGALLHSTVAIHTLGELSGGGFEAADPRAMLDEIAADPELFADPKLDQEMRWQYPDSLSARKPLKLTVSGMLRELEGPEQLPVMAQRPQFLTEESARRMTGTERGTAYHRAMQLLRLDALKGLKGPALTDEIQRQLNIFAERRLITEVQREAIRPKLLAGFFSTELGQRLLQAETVRREWPFNVMLRVKEALSAEEAGIFEEEELLVQGSIDCCFLESDGWILLDYKTDRSDDLEALRAHYHNQLHVYALALERITGIPVRQKMLCLLGSSRVLEV